ncbi:MAG TPA: phenylacetate--CoA ligase [Dehalococcoidia bacterium]|nr:phenylacetate--CoA ligase [Dehalococcoidia bacterium]
MRQRIDYWDPDIETSPLAKLKELQEERLQTLVRTTYQKVPFYRKKLDQAKVKPEDVNTLTDITKLPLTRYVEDFVATPIQQKLAVQWESVTEIMTTSGTISGFTQPVAMTARDVEEGFSLMARTMRMAGVKSDDIVQFLLPLDMLIPAVKRLGCKVMPSMAGRMRLDDQIKLAKLMKSSVAFAMPSYMMGFVQRARELDIDLRNGTNLRLAVLGGEPLAAPIRKRIEEETGIDFYDLYGFAEVMGVGGECIQREGLHIWADHYIPEVIDPDTLQPLEPGIEGELVITTLTKEAMPLIRYRTGDMTKLLAPEPCPCGRTHPKIGHVRGRVYDVIRIQGLKLLPSDVEDIIVGIPGLGGEYRIIIDKKDEMDVLKIKAEHKSGVSNLMLLQEEVKAAFKQTISLRCQIWSAPNSDTTC